MSLSDKAVSGIKYGPIDHGHVIQMLENISKYIDSLDLEGAKSAIHSYISDLTQGENKGFEDNAPGFLNDDMDDEAILGELTPSNTEGLYTEQDMSRHFEVPRAGSPEHLALIEKQNPGTLEKWVSNKMKEVAERLGDSDDKHWGEGQAEGLDNLLEGLRDTPHDNRW